MLTPEPSEGHPLWCAIWQSDDPADACSCLDPNDTVDPDAFRDARVSQQLADTDRLAS